MLWLMVKDMEKRELEKIKKEFRYYRIISFCLPVSLVGLFLGHHAWVHNANFFSDYSVRILGFSSPAWFFFTIVIIVWMVILEIFLKKAVSRLENKSC